MEIRTFLYPKESVSFVTTSATMKDALECLAKCQFTAIPIIDEAGKYVGTLSEGDLLWKMYSTPGLTFDNMDTVNVMDIRKRIFNESVRINAEFDEMLELAADQNFVPVVDDEGVFLGIIRRKDIIEYYTRNLVSD